MTVADQVRWFDPLGQCAGGCGKSGTGVLRGPRNESYGVYCKKCADRRLKKAVREREKEQFYILAQDPVRRDD